MRLALPARQASRGIARLGRQPLFLAAPSRVFSAPRTLDVPLPRPQAQQGQQHPAQSQEDPAAARRAYANAARDSEALYDRILAGAAQLAREADADLRELTDRSENELAMALAQLDEDLAQRRLDAAHRRDFVLDHVASRTDLLRYYVVEQANGALGRMAALRKELLGEIERIRAPTRPAIAELTIARDEAYDAANQAHFAIQQLERDPAAELANASEFQVIEIERGPMLVAAMLEAAEHYGPPRFATDDQLLADRLGVVSNFVDPLLACTKCEIDAKVYAIEQHAENLGVAGPRALRSARDSTLRSIDKTEQRLILTVQEAHRATDTLLIDRHEQTRGILVLQAGQLTMAMRRDVEGSGQRLIEALGSVAATQPSALSMVHDEIERAAAATPARAANMAVRASERLSRNTRNAAQRHPSTLLARAERNQALRTDRTAAAGRDQKSLVGGFSGQQARLLADSFDQVRQSIDESLFGMAGMPGQVGRTCDSMLRTARQALDEVKKTTKEQIDAIVEKLTFACDGLMPAAPPGTTATGTESGHATAPEPLMCTPGDEPNMSVFDPAASSSSMSSSPLMSMAPNSSPMMSLVPTSPLMSVMPPASTTAPGPTTATTTPPAGTGGAAAGPASCGTCDSTRAAARGPAGPEGSAAPGTAPGSGTSGESDGAPAQAGGAGDDAGVCSDRTEMRSPRAFKLHCDPIAANPLTAPTTAEFITTVHNNLTQMLDARVEIAYAALQRTGETDYGKLFKDCLRGLTRIQGQAFTERYQKAHHRDLASEIRAHAHDSLFTAASTDIYNSRAAVAALEGRAADAAMDELRAAFNYSNETGRIFEIMQTLSQDQMAELLNTHEDELRELMGQLSTSDQARFDLLMNGRTVRARSTELKSAVDQANGRFRTGRDSDRRGFALGDAIAEAENPAQGRWALEGAADRVDVFGLEDPGVRQARERRHWSEIQEDFVNLDGVADEIARADPDAAMSRPDAPPGAALLAYATRPLTYRVYQPYLQQGETREQALERQARDEGRYGVTLGAEERDQYGHVTRTATTTLSEYQQLYLEMAVLRGSQSREARAARALAQFRRRDGVLVDYRDMEKSLHSGLGDAREGGNFEHAPEHVVDADRLQTFVMMERFRRQIEGGATGPISGTDARAMFRGEMEAAYRNRPDDLDVALGVIDSDAGNMQAVIDQAIRREDPALLTRYLGRMDSNQIEEVVTEWNRRHPGGPGLREKLGVGRGNHWSVTNWNGAVFTGDEANALELAMFGVPQTPLQKAEVQHRVIQQQIEQAGWLGKLLCSDEYDAMVANARRLREVMGVTESQFDNNGRVIVTDPQTGEPIKFNFDSSGRFVPARGGDVTLFQSLLGTSRIVAENYTAATDRMASFITTGIAIIVGAILSVATLGMGTAAAIALVGAALTIAVNASMRGGRYSRDDFTRDIVNGAVQAVTAGLGAGISNVARGAQTAALAGKVATATFTRSLSIGQRLLLTASRHPIITGAAMGAFSSGVTTALDPAMRRREDYGDQVWNAIFRGGAGGAVTAGVMHGMTSGASALAQRYAASRAMAYALQRGVSNEVAMRYAARASLAALRGRTLEVGWRTIAGGTGGMLGRGAEMAYENRYAQGRHTSEDFFREMRNAFIHSAAQNFLEGAGGRWKRTSTQLGREHDSLDRQTQRDEAYAHAARAFDRESARMGMAPRPPVGAPVEGAPGPARPAREEAATPARPPAANDNEPAGVPVPRRVGEPDEGPALRLPDEAEPTRALRADDEDGPRLRTAGGEDEDLRLRTHSEDEGPRLRSADSDDSGPITRKIPVVQYGLAELNASNVQHPAPITDQIDLTPQMLKGSRSIPEESRIRATNPHSEEASLANYHALRQADLHREVLLARCVNPSDERYGQYMVIQGGPDSVSRPPNGWITERHSHPRLYDMATSAERLTRSLPSGEGADFGILRREVDMMAGMINTNWRHTRESVIDIRLGERQHETRFSITRSGSSYEYNVGFRPPIEGIRRLGPFRSLADYEAAASNLTGQKWGTGAQERLYSADAGGGTISASRPRSVHGEPLTPSMRQDIEFVAGRMALAGEFEGQAAGTRPRGDLDPVVAEAATLADVHARVVRMGLVGEPDAMIRLHNILNDDDIPLATRAMISDVTLTATRNHLLETGQLAPGEPLVILFHGASSGQTNSLVKDGIDFARHRPGGRDDDFGEGLYLTQSLETGLKYRDRRSASAGGGRGSVIPYMLRGRDLGEMVNVSTGGSLRAQWEAFAVANARTLVNNLGDSIMFTELMGRILTGRVTRFSEFDETLIRNRGQLFNDFLASVGKRPDVIFGDLGGPLTHGIALRQMTDQAVVRSQSVGDIMNRQHVRAGTADSDVTSGGPHALGTGGDDMRLRTEPLRPVTRDGPAPGSQADPAERAAMRRKGPDVDEINAAQRALRRPSKDGVRGAVAAVRRGGPDAAEAQARLNRLYDLPKGSVVVDISDARIKRLADGLEPGMSHDVLVEGMWLRLYRAQKTDANPNPPVRYDASVPPHVPGQPRRVYQFGSGELMVWRATPTRDEPAGRLIQSSLVSAGKVRAGLEDNMFSHGESYERTAQTPVGPQAAGYHGTALERGHLHGAGLGMESPFGIGLVPREVNQTLQNRGIEGWMRRLRDALPPGAEMIYSTDVSWHKTSNRHSRIGYRIDIVIQGRRVPFAEFAIHVEADLPWTPQAQRRGTTGVFVSPLEFRPSRYPRVDNYFRALREIVDTPEVLHSGLARAAPSREQIGRTLHQLQPDEIRNIARAAEPWELASHNPAPSGTFSVRKWERGLTRILNREVRPRYIVVDLRGQGLKPLQKEQIGRALERLSERDQRRILLLDDNATYSGKISPVFRSMLLAAADDDDS